MKSLLLNIRLLVKFIKYFLCLCVIGCANSNRKTDECTALTKIFSITIPCSYKQSQLKSIDSYAGTITVDSVNIIYDYGLYNVPPVIDKNDYIFKRRWLPDAISILPLETNKTYDINAIINAIKILKVDTTNAIVNFSYNHNVYKYKIKFPDDIENSSIFYDIIDERESVFIVRSESASKRKQITLIIQGEKGVEFGRPSYSTLKISSETNTLVDSAILVRVFKTIKFLN